MQPPSLGAEMPINTEKRWEPFMSGTTSGTSASSGIAGTTATDETSDLIASDKVEGTAVYNRQGSGWAPCIISW